MTRAEKLLTFVNSRKIGGSALLLTSINILYTKLLTGAVARYML